MNSKLAIITGASSGIGEAFAKKLSQRGCDTILISRNKEKLGRIAQELNHSYGTSPTILQSDLSQPEGLEKVLDYISQTERVDGLVNNAGFGTHGQFSEVEIDKSLRMIALHVTAPTQLSYSVLPKMHQGGFIINVSSLASLISRTGGVVYSSTKSYLNDFSRALQREIQDRGISVQALCPGLTHTDFHNTQEFEFREPKVPELFWMNPEEVAEKSLKNLGKKVIYVPGLMNKLLRAGLADLISKFT